MIRTFRTPGGVDLPLLNLRGKEYLEVKYRLVWFREQRPDWRIETEIISHDKEVSVVRAVVKDSSGNIMAVGHKREDRKDFNDHLEKAESSAIGRAVAMLGFGTQFVADELDEIPRIVDSPTEPKEFEPDNSNEFKEPPWDPEEPFPGTETQGAQTKEEKISFGKYKGLTPTEAVAKDGLPKVQDYIKWMQEKADEGGKPLQGSALFLKVAIERKTKQNGART